MDNSEYKNLIYRKQFIIMPCKAEGPSGWKTCGICNERLVLHAHPDLQVTQIDDEKRRILLLGYMLDWQNPGLGNHDILSMLVSGNGDFKSFLEATFNLGGRFVIIYEDSTCSRLFHDATGQMEVYRYCGDKGVACAAQLPIMKKYLDLEDNTAEGVQEFYKSEDFKNAKMQWVGEDTIYKDTKELRPNFYLDLMDGSAVRYWPMEPLGLISVESASEMACRMLKGFLDAISRRSKVVLPVTAGWDSRLMLSATKDIRDRMTYYIIKFPGMDEDHVDIRVPKSLFEKIQVPFNVIDASGEVDDDFRRVFIENTAYPKLSNLPGVYNVFHKIFNDNVNISSQVSETVRNYRGTIKSPSGRLFSTRVGYDGNNKYAARMCDIWLEQNAGVAKEMNIDLLALFTWEEGMSWEASHRSETNISIEEYAPFSCRNLLTVMLSVNDSYRNKYNCTLYRKMMEMMWPEVLYEPINPSLRNNVKGFLISMDKFYATKKLIKNVDWK